MSMHDNLRAQDVVVALHFAAHPGQPWAYTNLSRQTHLSASEAHAAVKRLVQAQLVSGSLPHPEVHTQDLYLFLLHGLRHVFPAQLGTLTRGMPTAYAAPPLNATIAPSSDPPPVWPTPDGPVRGLALQPLYRTAPAAARENERLYQMLALADSLRSGRVRERKAAAQELAKLLGIDPSVQAGL